MNKKTTAMHKMECKQKIMRQTQVGKLLIWIVTYYKWYICVWIVEIEESSTS